MNPLDHLHHHGPTSCAPQSSVLKSIRKQITASGALSSHELRIARRMGIVASSPVDRLGFNDGVIYPYEPPMSGLRAGIPLAALASAARAPVMPGPRKMHALVLLVDFSDNPGTRKPAEFAKLLFNKKNPDSMASFYRKLSYGNLDVGGEVTQWLRMPHPYQFYTAGQSGTGDAYPNNTPGLLEDALTLFCQNDTLTRFDTDQDGFVDGIFLIHAGGGAEAEPNAVKRKNMIWSHKWTLPQPFVNQGVQAYSYSTEPEDGKVGVFSHEFGHVLGLPDLYDTTYRSHGIGDWCLMAGGSWGGGGDRPARMSAWCLSTLGWITPNIITGTHKLKLKSLETSKEQCHRLWTHGAMGNEYFLIENRQASGLDASLPSSGLAVWHIDETQSTNDNPVAYKVALVQADGKKHLELLKNSGDAADLFPGTKKVTTLDDSTTPSTRSNLGSPTGVALANIKLTGATVTLDAAT